MKHDIATTTIAELYERQGHLDRAIKVYSDILDSDPDNDSVRERLERLKAGMDMSGEGVDGQIERLEAWLSNIRAARSGEVAAVADSKTEEPVETDEIDAQVNRLEAWLNNIRAIRSLS